MPKKLTNKEFLQRLKELDRDDIEPLEEYNGRKTKILFRCLKPDCDKEFYATPDHILGGEGCPICAQKKRVESRLNNLENLKFGQKHPELVDLIVEEEQELAFKYGPQSDKKVHVMCPDCKSVKLISFANLDNYGFSCSICSDGVSFPNKFVRQILLSKGIEFESEWNDEGKIKGFYYDIKLSIENKIILLELDGEYHFSSYRKKGDIERVKIRDRAKDKLAKENTWELIRIDVRGSNPEIIYERLINSRFSEYFNIKNVDLKSCELKARKSIFIEVCNYFNQNTFLTYGEIGREFGMHKETIGNYLKKGRKLGLVKESRKNSSKRLLVYKGGKLLKEYMSVTECEENFLKDFGVEFKRDSIYRAIRKFNGCYKGYLFKYKKSY